MPYLRRSFFLLLELVALIRWIRQHDDKMTMDVRRGSKLWMKSVEESRSNLSAFFAIDQICSVGFKEDLNFA
jgi:hypothetical protein